MGSVVAGVQRGELLAEDCDVELLNRAMYTADLPTPELLVRTSGETRLSDFMLWQCATSHLAFTPVLWPSFSWWEFLKILLEYQRHFPQLAAVSTQAASTVLLLSGSRRLARQAAQQQHQQRQLGRMTGAQVDEEQACDL